MKHNSKIYLLSIVLLFSFLKMNGQQNQCGSIATMAERKAIAKNDAEYVRPASRLFEDNTIKVIMYRLRESDGSEALSDSAFAEEINNLNTYYQAHNICFSLMRIVNIDNSAYLDLAKWSVPATADSLKNAIANENPWFNDAITIYVLPPTVFYRGSAYGIPSTALIMSSQGNRWSSSHIAHEMGHCLGNLHTHDDTDDLNLEMVERFCPFPVVPFPNDQGLWFDCCLGADYLCSTPADPRLGDTTSYGTWRVNSTTCIYSDTTATDPFGNLYNPDVSNVMSYAPINCRSTFSWEQVNRFHSTLDLNLDFSNVQASTDLNFGDATYSNGYAHFLATNEITIAPNVSYEVNGSAQVIHATEGIIDLKPGFVAAPSTTEGLFKAQAKNICENDPDLFYDMNENTP